MHVEKIWKRKNGMVTIALPEVKSGRAVAYCYFDLRGRGGMGPVRGPLLCGTRASERAAAGLDAGLAPLPGFCRCSACTSVFDPGFADGLCPAFASGLAPDVAPAVVPGRASGLGPDFIQGCLLPPDFDIPGFWGLAMLTTISRST